MKIEIINNKNEINNFEEWQKYMVAQIDTNIGVTYKVLVSVVEQLNEFGEEQLKQSDSLRNIEKEFEISRSLTVAASNSNTKQIGHHIDLIDKKVKILHKGIQALNQRLPRH